MLVEGSLKDDVMFTTAVGAQPGRLQGARREASISPASARRLVRLADAAVLLLATSSAIFVSTDASLARVLAESLSLVVVGLLVMHALKLHRARVSVVRATELRRLALTAIAVGAAAAPVAPTNPVPAGAGVAAAALLVLAAERSAVSAAFRVARVSGRLRRPVVIVGTTIEAGRLIELIDSHPELGYDVRAVVGDRGESEREHTRGVPWMGPSSVAADVAEATGASGAILIANGIASAELNHLIRELQDRCVHVHLWSGAIGIDRQRVRVVPFAHEPMLYLEPRSSSLRRAVAKRIVDVIGASIGLLILAPVAMAAAVAIVVTDRGPVLFRQRRIGRDGVPFVCLKLRTMVVGAEELRAQLEQVNERRGPLFKCAADPRTTRIGRFLRESSIDEIPQLVNVLCGQMSLVGPRPALPEEVEEFDASLRARHRVRPGVTGLWQLEARDNPAFYAYRHLDLFYVDNATIAMDLVIIASTTWSVLFRAAATTARRADELWRSLRRPHHVSDAANGVDHAGPPSLELLS